MSEQMCEQRRERLRALMREQGIEALLISHAANRYYLSGFELHDVQLNESAGRLIVMADGKDWILTDSRYLDAARRLWEPERVFIYGADAPEDIAKLLKGLVPGKTIGFEARAITLEFYEKFAETLAGSGCRLSKADGLVEQLRVIKDAEEIRRMEISCRLNQQMMEWLPGVLVPGRSEAAVSWDIEMFFRHHGATELAFTSIVGMAPTRRSRTTCPPKTPFWRRKILCWWMWGAVWKTTAPIRPGLSGSVKSRRSDSKRRWRPYKKRSTRLSGLSIPVFWPVMCIRRPEGTSSLSALPKPLRMGSGMASDWKPTRGRALTDATKPRLSPE